MNTIGVVVNEETVNRAIEALNKTTGFKAKQSKGYLTLGGNKVKLKLLVTSQAVDRATAGLLKQDDEITDSIVVTRHVYPKQAHLLKQLNISFIDMAGNAYINKPPLFIYVQGQQPITTNNPKPIRAFKKTGLKIIFAFLCNPGLENSSYREIASSAGVALGAVGRTMEDLTEKGFLRKKGRKGVKLINKKELLNRWVTAYPDQLRPGLFTGQYILNDIRNVISEQSAIPYGYLWGGEIAAEMLSDTLVAKMATVYTSNDIKPLAMKLRLRKNEDGNLEALNKFWGFENNERTVPPILIYADLLATGLERNIETAKGIYESEIKALLT